ncbi:MAG TPA: zinc-binding dehydrogenase, partial [Steroidobacteraceae bacterium]|nr:zinc-binding dehydrogenase [Steroidobacteraceae bacterium]
MKAWLTYGYGDMRLEEVPEPEVRPGWVKLRIRVVQPSITETSLFQGARTYGHALIERALAQGPAQLFGHEFSGEVVEVGAGVTALRIRDRVAARGSHPDGIVGFDYPGALAEYGVFPESLLAVLPDHVSDSEGAAIQPLTDAVAAVHAAEIELGDVVVVIGQGSMGLACLQVARAAGAGKVIGVARRDSVLDVSKRLGADATINVTRQDPVATVREITEGRGADVVFETAGGPAELGLAGSTTLLQGARMLRDRGRLVGVAFDGEAAVLPYAEFRPRSLRFLFPSMLDRHLFETTVALVATGRVDLKPMITHVLDGLDQVPQAFALTADKARHGLINPAQVVVS